MNDMRIATAGATPTAAGQKAGVPLSLAIFAMRLFEFIVVLATGMIATLRWVPELTASQASTYQRVVIVAAVAYGVLAETLGCYDIDAQFSLRRAWQRVSTAWVVATVFMITLGFLLKSSDSVSRAWAVGWFAFGGVTLMGARATGTMWVRRLKRRGTFDQRVAIFGAGEQGQRLADYIQSHERLTISLVGFFDDRRDGRVPATAVNLPVLGNLSALIAMIREGMIDQVIVALPWSAATRLEQVVSRLAMTPVRIRLAPDLASFTFTRRPVVLLGDVPVMTLFERPISGTDAIVKAVEDRVLAAIAVVLLSPVLLLVALAVKLESKGPVFFRQPREGFNNQPFRVFKFRSMCHNHAQLDGIKQASRGDPRVTRVGAFLREWSIDELPQLFNVLAGDMSMVGPRPHAPSTRAGGRLFSEVVASYAARHKVKPGITGWAQVCGWRGETDTEEKLVKRLEHDLYYIENWSIFFDFYILFRTVGAVLLRRNAF